MPFKPSWRLQTKLTVVFFLLVVVMVAIFFFLARMFYESEERIAFELRAVSLVSLLGESITNHLYDLRFDEMTLLLTNVRRQPHVLYAYAYDKDGRIVADGTKKNPYLNVILNDPLHSRAIKAEGSLLLQYKDKRLLASGNVLDSAQPIVLAGEKIGGVRIGFTLLPVQEKVAQTKSYTLLIGIIFVLAGGAFSVLMGRRLARPIKDLVGGTQLIASGNFDVKVSLSSADELGILAESFNQMAASLKRLQHMSRLKRYLSPQIAEAILKSEENDIFKSHRREITVVFLDLRGFTAFSDSAEPEEVMALLRSYHEEMGKLIFRFEGTLEHFAGDGIMVFFNDPIPCDDHTEKAVRMALAMRASVKELRTEWLKKGHDLDLGVGFAAGYATLGNIGFEGRMDYGALGNVTNLAARLCGEAKGGQILTDQKTLAKIESIVEAAPLEDLHLKGFARPVPAFNIASLKQ